MQRKEIDDDSLAIFFDIPPKKKRDRLGLPVRDPIAEAVAARLQDIFKKNIDDAESRAFVLEQLNQVLSLQERSKLSSLYEYLDYFSCVKIISEAEAKAFIDAVCCQEKFPYGANFVAVDLRLMLFTMNYIMKNPNCTFDFRIDFFNRFFPVETFDGGDLDQALRKPIEQELIYNLTSRLSVVFIYQAGDYLQKVDSLDKVYFLVPLLDALFESIKFFLKDRDIYDMPTVYENINYVFKLCDKIDEGIMAEVYRARYFELLLLLYHTEKYRVQVIFIECINNLVLRMDAFPRFCLPGKRKQSFKDCLLKLEKKSYQSFINAGVSYHLGKEEVDCLLVSHAKIEAPFVQAMRIMPIKPIFMGEIVAPEVEWSHFTARVLHPGSKAALCEWVLFCANLWREAAGGVRPIIEERIRSFFYFLSKNVAMDYSLHYKNELLKKLWKDLPPGLKNILDPAEKINAEILKNLLDSPVNIVFSREEIMALKDNLLKIARHKSRAGESRDARSDARHFIESIANKVSIEDDRRNLFDVLASLYCLLKSPEKILCDLLGVKPGAAKDQVMHAVIEWICLLHKESYGDLPPDFICKEIDFDYLRFQNSFKVNSAAIWDQLGAIISQKVESKSIEVFKDDYAIDLRFFHYLGRFKEKTSVDVAFIQFFEKHKGVPVNFSNVSLYLDESLQRHILIELHGQYLSWIVPQTLEARLVMSLNSFVPKGTFNLTFVFALVFNRIVPDDTRLHLSNVLLNFDETAAFFSSFEIAMNRAMRPEIAVQEKSYSEALCHNFFHGYLYTLYAKDYFKMRSNKSLSASDKQKGKDISHTRPDLLCISSDREHAVIFEFKFSKDSSLRSASSPAGAIAQIEKQYLAHDGYWQHAVKVDSHRNKVKLVIAVGVEFYLHEGLYRLNFLTRCFERKTAGFSSIPSALNLPKLHHSKSEFEAEIHHPDYVAKQIQTALCELSSHNFPTQRSEFFESFVLGLFSGLPLSRFEKYLADCQGYFLEFNSKALALCVISATGSGVNQKVRATVDRWCLQLLAQGVPENLNCYVIAMNNPGRGRGAVVMGVFQLRKDPVICFYYPEKICQVRSTSISQPVLLPEVPSMAGGSSFFPLQKKLKVDLSSAAGAGGPSSAHRDEEVESLENSQAKNSLVQGLVDLLTHADVIQKETAVACLWSLILNDADYKNVIRRAKGILPLLNLLKNPVINPVVLITLSSLVSNNTDNQKIVLELAGPSLLERLKKSKC